ncbi:hypothetical protein SDC9_154527 [bioreactor metagenome]|uniref:Uncharacterized protein n=1 Tax=bioreactor metagenome TaxID=1076179 RepID=A0A645EZ03_9ZZZZ
MQHFAHIQKSLRRSSRKGAASHHRRTHRRRHGAVFAFHMNILAVQRAIGEKFRQTFHDNGLGGDGVGRYHIWTAQAHAVGDRFIAR